MSVKSLPNLPLDPKGALGALFLKRGIETFREAALYIQNLPYGRTSDRSDLPLVLREGRGTCSTKHALLAELAGEVGCALVLCLGIYEMDEKNTPGIANVLRRDGLASLPEAHCYLLYRKVRVDLTTSEAAPPRSFLYEEEITPDKIGAYKLELHRNFARKWSEAHGLDFEKVWKVREECIAALSAGG